MTSNLFWFSDEQWLKIEPHLPVNQPGHRRIQDFRRIATRYDKLARNFFSAVCFVPALAFWL
jgi:transposase